MKYLRNIWNKFISEENIAAAVNKSVKGRKNRTEIVEFLKNPEPKIDELKRMLATSEFPPHKYRSKIIHEGKQRLIFSVNYFPWRILHHMVINIIEPFYEKSFIEHTYGCIKGRGQHKGSNHCKKLVKKFKYCMKCDVKKFYPSINQDILFSIITEKVKDERFLNVLKHIVYSHKEGLPIGNLTSQLFGNIYMSKLDNFVKHSLRAKNYVRYVDDFLICSNDKQQLHEYLRLIEQFLKVELKLELGKKQIFNVKQGIDFLGYRHFKKYTLLRKSTATRIKRVVKRLPKDFQTEKKSYEQCIGILSSYKGWMQHCNCFNLTRAIHFEEVKEDLVMRHFKEFNIKPDLNLVGQKVSITSLYGQSIVVTNAKIIQVKDAEFPTVQLQFKYKETDDKHFIAFTQSNILRKQVEEFFEKGYDFPFEATIKYENNSSFLA